MFKEYDNCKLCPHCCGVNRNKDEKGACGEGSVLRAAKATLHFWEEPILSNANGSGTVFFSGCSLKCVFCQNYQLSKENRGIEISAEELAQIFLGLQEKGANNINLVTAEHFAPSICKTIETAKKLGLRIPVILNCSGYTTVDTLKMLEKYIDIYLADFKYFSDEIAKKYSKADNYRDIAYKAIEEMVRQQPDLIYDDKGLLKKGVIVRHLCLPMNTQDSKKVLKSLFDKYGNNICYSIMSQYTPTVYTKDIPPLNRTLSKREYESVVDYCIALGIENAFVQEGESASESFIPEFDGTGIM